MPPDAPMARETRSYEKTKSLPSRVLHSHGQREGQAGGTHLSTQTNIYYARWGKGP